MNFEVIGIWIKIRNKGFVFHILAATLLTLILLTLLDLIIDKFILEKSIELENYLWWEIPTNALISFLFAIWKWYFKGKRLELKSDVIEMNLNKKDEKEKK